MKKQIILLLPVILGLLLILPIVSAATTLVSPIANGNYSTTMTLNCTTAVNASGNSYNVSFWYNASGGATGTLLTTVSNTSAAQNTFTSASYSITSLADGALYNFTCKADNGSTQEWSAAKRPITIDDTNPIVAISLDTSTLNTHGTVTGTWSSSDATSGLITVVTTLTSPDSTRCATKTYTNTAKVQAWTGEDTKCQGTYTASITATDYSGNSATASKTFKTYDSGLTKSGSNTLGGSEQSQFSQGQEINSNIRNLPLGQPGTNIVILLIVIVAIYFLLKK